jgi:hypothetical protein
MVLILPPPPTVTPRPQYETVEPQTALVRIFNPASRYKTQAKQYRFFGPLLRFDHQQPLIKQEVGKFKGKEDPLRGITYWGFTLSCCLVELFGDTKIVEFKDYEVAIATLEQPLLLLDIRDQGAMAAGSVAALGSVADRLVSQAWSRYFYEQIDIYQKVLEILFTLNAPKLRQLGIMLYLDCFGVMPCVGEKYLRPTSVILMHISKLFQFWVKVKEAKKKLLASVLKRQSPFQNG